MSTTLPFDVIVDEILTRTSLETVVRSRTLCKKLNTATYEWSFLKKLNLQTPNIVSGFFIRSNQIGREFFPAINNRDLPLAPGNPREPVKIEVVTKQGLILCSLTARGPTRFFVYNPATQKRQYVPSPEMRLHRTQMFAMTVISLNALRYKIVRFSCMDSDSPQLRKHNACRCEVFDTAMWEWRVLPENIKLPSPETICFNQPTVSAGGVFYALTSLWRVFTFDWETERFGITVLPAPSRSGLQQRLFGCEGKLGLVSVSESHKLMELRVLEYVHGSCIKTWNLRKILNIECLFGGLPPPRALAMPSSDIVVFKTCKSIKFLWFGSSENRVLESVIPLSTVSRRTSELLWIESDLRSETKSRSERGHPRNRLSDKRQRDCQFVMAGAG